GGPQVLRHSAGSGSSGEVVAVRGEDAVLGLVVCADPRPRHAAWEWGSLQLQAGEGLGRYHAEQLIQDRREDCYEARLHVREVDPADSRTYFLVVENEKGTDRHFLRLAVRGSYAPNGKFQHHSYQIISLFLCLSPMPIARLFTLIELHASLCLFIPI
ncbi:hypothetical protein AAG570_001406, partial [Ranatra chinensis]